LHVVLISNDYPPFIIGGVGTFVENLAHGLLRRGVKVTVLAGYPVPRSGFKRFNDEKEQTDSGLNVIRFPYPKIPPCHLWFQIFNLRKISKIVSTLDADVIHGQGGIAYPALIGLKNISSSVVTHHSNPKTELGLSLYSMTRGASLSDIRLGTLGYPYSNYTFKKEFEMSDASVAVSKAQMSDLILDIGIRNSGKMHYIHNGVNLEQLEKEYASVDCEKERDIPLLFYGGRLYWRKGVLNLVRLANVLQKKYHLNYKIVVHGTGPLRGKMEALIREYGLSNISLRGFTGRAEFLRDMKRSSYVIIPSTFEACPMILLESMCLGKIPVMFNLPYSSEMTMQGEYGLLSHNIEDMAAKIFSFQKENDPEVFEDKIRSFARKQYSVSRTATQYHDLYKSIC
jgi:glycosyltransferase involved in cell wall biosynthesis